MSATRIALVGMGRIGRDLLRILYRDDSIRIAAIDEIAEHTGVEYLIRFDTIHVARVTGISVPGPPDAGHRPAG